MLLPDGIHYEFGIRDWTEILLIKLFIHLIYTPNIIIRRENLYSEHYWKTKLFKLLVKCMILVLKNMRKHEVCCHSLHKELNLLKKKYANNFPLNYWGRYTQSVENNTRRLQNIINPLNVTIPCHGSRCHSVPSCIRSNY